MNSTTNNTTATNNYSTHTDYAGSRNILVPTRMYSRNSMMSMMHIKSKRFLGVNLDRYVMTFHKTKDGTDKDPKDEIAFNHIKSVDADVSSADKQKYYLTVKTDDGDLKFKFQNVKDFHTVVEALRHTMQNDKPMYTANDTYHTAAAKVGTYDKDNKDKLNRSASSISSDDAHDYQLEDKDRDAVKKGIKADANYQKDRINTDYKADNASLKTNLESREHDYMHTDNSIKYNIDKNESNYKVNKDVTKDTYDANKDAIKDDYKANKDYLKDQKSHAHGAEKDAIKNQLDANKDEYKYRKESNENAYDATKDLNKDSYKANKDNLKDAKDYNSATYKADKDYTKNQMDMNATSKDAAIRDVNMNKDADLKTANGY